MLSLNFAKLELHERGTVQIWNEMNLTQKQFLNNFLATHILLKFPVGVKLSSASFFSLSLNKFRAEKMNDG